ncbi:hypothetical protein GBF38_003962 [Nibea albiflora]|uniref:Uncharacterized protein n=1 Tax=Nibea albiflora TaxID=240163 RepID=A0ACB7FBN8_NIBAL|nr:hypothetical protein GBF38_003962 [Nibea albiflora]
MGRQLLFYDYNPQYPQVQSVYVEYGLNVDYVVTTMNYWSNGTKGIFSFGTDDGCLLIFISYEIKVNGLFNKHFTENPSLQDYPTYYGQKLLSNKSKDYLYIKIPIFDDVCKHISYFPSLDSFAVCGKSSERMALVTVPRVSKKASKSICKQVISICQNGVVIVWDILTGEAVMKFKDDDADQAEKVSKEKLLKEEDDELMERKQKLQLRVQRRSVYQDFMEQVVKMTKEQLPRRSQNQFRPRPPQTKDVRDGTEHELGQSSPLNHTRKTKYGRVLRNQKTDTLKDDVPKPNSVPDKQGPEQKSKHVRFPSIPRKVQLTSQRQLEILSPQMSLTAGGTGMKSSLHMQQSADVVEQEQLPRRSQNQFRPQPPQTKDVRDGTEHELGQSSPLNHTKKTKYGRVLRNQKTDTLKDDVPKPNNVPDKQGPEQTSKHVRFPSIPHKVQLTSQRQLETVRDGTEHELGQSSPLNHTRKTKYGRVLRNQKTDTF